MKANLPYLREMATNKMEKAKMVRNLNSDEEEGCCGCTKIEPKKVVVSTPSEEQLSSNQWRSQEFSLGGAKLIIIKLSSNP